MKIETKHDFAAKLMQENVLPSVLNYVTWQREIRGAQARGEKAPLMPSNIALTSINLDLTTACNYRCDHCIDFDILNSAQRYEHDKLVTSLDKLVNRGLRSVILIGGGEPTLYPGFSEIVRFLKEREVQTAIVTNGSRNEKILEIADALSGRDWVRLSLDAGTDQTFQKMHKPKKAIRLEEICSWIPRIRARNPKLPVGFSFIIVWQGAEREQGVNIVENIGEMVQAARLAKESGFSYISFKPFLMREPSGAEVMDPSVIADFNSTIERIRVAVDEAKMLETDDFKVIESTNLRVLMQGNWRDFTKQPKTCHMTAFRQVISPLGVYHCPTHRGVSAGKISEALEDSQEPTAKLIEKFDAANHCKEITCLYNSVNWWIEELIENGIPLSEVLPLPDRGDYYL